MLNAFNLLVIKSTIIIIITIFTWGQVSGQCQASWKRECHVSSASRYKSPRERGGLQKAWREWKSIKCDHVWMLFVVFLVTWHPKTFLNCHCLCFLFLYISICATWNGCEHQRRCRSRPPRAASSTSSGQDGLSWTCRSCFYVFFLLLHFINFFIFVEWSGWLFLNLQIIFLFFLLHICQFFFTFIEWSGWLFLSLRIVRVIMKNRFNH